MQRKFLCCKNNLKTQVMIICVVEITQNQYCEVRYFATEGKREKYSLINKAKNILLW